jgi:MFS family permease
VDSAPRIEYSRDLAASAVGAFVFSFALGLAMVALPLLALSTGYSKTAIGYLTALSAVSQMGCRLGLSALMRRRPDWLIVFGAAGLLALSCLVAAVSSALVPFAAAELLQGAARGCFFTGSQTHVVRGTGSSVGRLASVNLISSGGQLAGPLLAGFLGNRSLPLALGVAAAIAGAGMIPPLLLDRLPPFAMAGGRRSPVWRRPGVMAGNLAGVTAGTWRAILGSYVPVALVQAGRTPGAIGVLIAVANGASLGGAAILIRFGHRRRSRAFVVATVATGVPTAVLSLVASITWLDAGALAISGIGAGVLQALGPAIASDSVGQDERGDAIAIAGTYRAAALFAAPLAIGASLTAIPLAVAIAIAGGAITLPAVLGRRVSRPADGIRTDGTAPAGTAGEEIEVIESGERRDDGARG